VKLEVPARRPRTLVMILVSGCQSILYYEQVGEDFSFILIWLSPSHLIHPLIQFPGIGFTKIDSPDRPILPFYLHRSQPEINCYLINNQQHCLLRVVFQPAQTPISKSHLTNMMTPVWKSNILMHPTGCQESWTIIFDRVQYSDKCPKRFFGHNRSRS